VAVDNNRIKIDGEVTECLPDTKFKVRLNDGREILTYLAGKMRMHYIRVIVGDTVTVELGPNDTIGKIIFRGKQYQNSQTEK